MPTCDSGHGAPVPMPCCYCALAWLIVPSTVPPQLQVWHRSTVFNPKRAASSRVALWLQLWEQHLVQHQAPVASHGEQHLFTCSTSSKWNSLGHILSMISALGARGVSSNARVTTSHNTLVLAIMQLAACSTGHSTEIKCLKLSACSQALTPARPAVPGRAE